MNMRESARGILEKEVSRVIRESRASNRANQNVSKDGGSMSGSERSIVSRANRRHSSDSHSATSISNQSQNRHRRHTESSQQSPSEYLPKAPGVKSFLLKAVRKPSSSSNRNSSTESSHPYSHNHRNASSSKPPDVSWISVDISEELLRGKDRFEVTAQLLGPEKYPTNTSRSKAPGMILRHEYRKDEELLILDLEFGAAILRLKIYW